MLSSLNIEQAFGNISFGRRSNLNVHCPFHADETESCSVSNFGVFSCKACGAKGGAAKFYARVHDITLQEAEVQLTATPKKRRRKTSLVTTETSAPLDQALVVRTTKHLLKSKVYQKYLLGRGLTPKTLELYSIGADEYRITIPVFDNGRLVNVRRYLPDAQSAPKMVSHVKGDGSPRLYPDTWAHHLEPGAEVILCEGEWDCLLLRQHGFNAVTTTGSVSTWSSEWTDLLQSFSVIIIFDVHDIHDDLGQRMARMRAEELLVLGTQVKVVALDLPSKYIGGDITDYFVAEHRTATHLKDLIEHTPQYTLPTKPVKGIPPATKQVLLSDAVKPEYFYQPIRLKCLVAGKGVTPYLIPKKFTAQVTTADDTTTVTHTIDEWDSIILSLLDCTLAQQKRLLCSIIGAGKTAQVSIVVEEALAVEELFLIPAIETGTLRSEYTLRKCYYVGTGIRTNQVYVFEGYTLPHPKTQAATHVLIEAESAETDIDAVVLTSKEYKRLAALFQTNNVSKKLEHIAVQLAEHVTHIYGRTDLHTAVELVFHSPLSFVFNNILLHKGWIEALILGDTRTGKGFVAENLIRHFGAGETVSGENCSLAGLVGGVQRLGDKWTLVWGRIPLADRRLVVIDEANSLTTADIGKLSRIRSEGVAEVTKVVTDKTHARTRLLWLANPRTADNGQPRMIADFNYGIDAVSDLIGNSEDIARFDFAMIVGQAEVSSQLINDVHVPKGRLQYKAADCQLLVQWVWSRTAEQISFSEEATTYTLKAAYALGNKFVPRPCLVQSEDIRYKLARIACAAAARTFSTEDGVVLLVSKAHVEYAYNFLHHVYSKPTCGYEQSSMAARQHATLRDPALVQEALESAGDQLPDLIDGLLEHRIITARDLSDYAAMNIYQARTLISELVRSRAIVKERFGYVKKPAFKKFLFALKASLSTDPPVTMEEV